MIIFDYNKYLRQIKKDGIGATDIRANEKIDALLTDMIFNSTYKKGKIISKVKEIANGYYKGLPDDLINAELSKLYDEIKEKQRIKKEREEKVLTLYKSEMEKIVSLPDEKIQRLAFACLVAFKYYSCHNVFDKVEYSKMIASCLPDIYMLAHFDNVSGATKNKLLNQLVNHGMLFYGVKTNPTYRYQSYDDANCQRWIAFNTMSVPYCVEINGNQDSEEVFMVMKNYDDVILYLRYYLGDESVITCECCGTPILKSGNAKRICSDCAEQKKKASDKARYNSKLAV
ncbi:MAG: hypothetical protein IKO36_03880 [Bacteroidaceae bacterium]|nr:hypothetical protein [Bacteroidaceae bacterium]